MTNSDVGPSDTFSAYIVLRPILQAINLSEPGIQSFSKCFAQAKHDEDCYNRLQRWLSCKDQTVNAVISDDDRVRLLAFRLWYQRSTLPNNFDWSTFDADLFQGGTRVDMSAASVVASSTYIKGSTSQRSKLVRVVLTVCFLEAFILVCFLEVFLMWKPDNQSPKAGKHGELVQKSTFTEDGYSTQDHTDTHSNSTGSAVGWFQYSRIVPDNDWWSDIAQSIAIPFLPWQSRYSWCDLHPSVPYNGFLFHKLFKTGSSTAAGVHMRIARQVAQRIENRTVTEWSMVGPTTECSNYFKHAYGLSNRQRQRNKSNSFLWTIIRYPSDRSLSAYFFYKVGLYRRETITTQHEAALLRYLQTTKHVQFLQVRDDPRKPKLKAEYGLLRSNGGLNISQWMPNVSALAGLVQRQVLQSYNFVAVLERWEESMVVLQLLLDLEDSDIIVLSSKSSGGWTWDWLSDKKAPSCFAIPKPVITNKTATYLRRDFGNNVDYLLYAAVNRSLDLTIDRLGRERVEAGVHRHRQLQQLVERECVGQATFPCSNTGVWQPEAKTDCYWRDMGCGYRCIDRVLENYK